MDNNGIDLISKIYCKCPNLLEILKILALEIASLSTNKRAQDELGSKEIYIPLITGMKQFINNEELARFSLFALRNLIFDHKENVERMLNTQILTLDSKIIENFISSQEVH